MASSPPPRSSGALKVTLAYCFCFLTWGSTWAVAKVALEDVPPLRLVGVRMLLAGLVLVPFIRTQEGSLHKGDWGRVMAVGALQIGLPFGMMFVGQQWIASSWAALLFATYPVWVLLVGRVLMPGQHLTPRKLLAAVLGVTGVGALQYAQLGALAVSGGVVVGGLLILGAAGLLSVANVLVKQHLGHVPPHLMVCVQTLTSSLPLLGASFVFEAGASVHWTPRALGALVWLALGGTVVTYQLFYWLLPRLTLSALGAMALLDALVAVGLGVGVLREPLTPSVLVGGLLILSATVLANRAPSKPAPKALETR
jgi:drug/metabolite transporter (DMT)-like permease